MRPYLRKTSCPRRTACLSNSVAPAASVTRAGIGGALVYVRTVMRESTDNPKIVTRMVAWRHQGDRPVGSPPGSVMAPPGAAPSALWPVSRMILPAAIHGRKAMGRKERTYWSSCWPDATLVQGGLRQQWASEREPMGVSSRTDHIQIARVIGIPIYLHFSWLIIFGLIVWTLSTGYFPAQSPDLPAASYWAKGLVASLLFFVSILLHELGHAVAARRHGLRTRSITLFIFGGVAQLEKDPRDGRAEFWMAAAGPLVSLALAGLFYLAASLPFVGPSAVAVAKYLALINLIL